MSRWSCRTQFYSIPLRMPAMHTPSMIMESSKISLVRRNHRLRLNMCMEAPMAQHLSRRAQMGEERARCTCASGLESRSTSLCMRGSHVFFMNINSFCVCLRSLAMKLLEGKHEVALKHSYLMWASGSNFHIKVILNRLRLLVLNTC